MTIILLTYIMYENLVTLITKSVTKNNKDKLKIRYDQLYHL